MNALYASPRGSTTRRRMVGAVTLLVSLSLGAAGCAGYRFGADSLYPSDIQTVYVPMFQSDSYRRGLAEQLTEAVCKEIEKRTNYKVVNTPNADSVLSGRILNEVKRIVVEAPTDEPRETQVQFFIEVTWLDRQSACWPNRKRCPCRALWPTSIKRPTSSPKSANRSPLRSRT